MKEQDYSKFKKHILIGKLGKATKIKQIQARTGDDNPVVFYAYSARMNPDWAFYFVGPNHLDKLTDEEYDKIFPYHNVFNANCVSYRAIKEHTEYDYQPLVDWFKDRNIKPDFMLFFNGVVSGNGNIEHFLKLKNGEYKKHFIGLSDNVTYVVEDITSKDVSNYAYTLNFNPKMWLPVNFGVVD